MAKRVWIYFLVAFVVGAALIVFFDFTADRKFSPPLPVGNFSDCVKRGFPVLESFPRQCRAPDGRVFIEAAVAETELRVFFSSSERDPGGLECERVYPVVRRVTHTLPPEQVALLELLKGPADTEKAQGFFTSINSDVHLTELVIKDGVARAEFDNNLQYRVGGSCRVTAIRAQITQTLLQFPEVREVVILINGRSEDILQP